MCEEKEGVMRNAMTTRAPGGAKNIAGQYILIGRGAPEISANQGNFFVTTLSI